MYQDRNYLQKVGSPRGGGRNGVKGRMQGNMDEFKRQLEEERAERVRSISKLKLEVGGGTSGIQTQKDQQQPEPSQIR